MVDNIERKLYIITDGIKQMLFVKLVLWTTVQMKVQLVLTLMVMVA
jgi:hypothetical protein